VQTHQGLSDSFVFDVTLGIDVESIASESIPDWPGFNPAQVYASGGELLKHLKQATGLVLRQLNNHTGFVRTSFWTGLSLQAYLDKAGLGLLVFTNITGQDLKPIKLCCPGGSYYGIHSRAIGESLGSGGG
jgi:hypothetical protein